MGYEELSLWTCDRCGASTDRDVRGAPAAWRFIDVHLPRYVQAESKTLVCPKCREVVEDALKPTWPDRPTEANNESDDE